MTILIEIGPALETLLAWGIVAGMICVGAVCAAAVLRRKEP